MSLATLPIPRLAETLERYLNWLRPLVSNEAYQHSRQLADDFLQNEGQVLQERLQHFAEQQNAQGKSWLSDAWLDAYMSVRDALPLATSGAFRLDLDLPKTGLYRLAACMLGLAKQSADYLNNELPVHTSPRGEPLDMGQWLALRGIGRVPEPGCDRYELAPTQPQPRYAIVFWQGVAYRLPLLDAQHKLYAIDDVVALLEQIVNQTLAVNDDITALSLAPAEQAHDLLQELSEHSENAANFLQLAHGLFHVHLSAAAFIDDAAALNALTFLADTSLWAYKPYTLCANLENDNYYAHLEHSSYDAGALQAIFERAMVTANELAAKESKHTDVIQATALKWSLTEAQQQQLAAIKQQHAEKADCYRVNVVTVKIQPTSIPERTSMDCLLQLVMQYAQLKTFGVVRNTYESVDVSHFQAGRTECIRPVSVESVAFVQGLINGTASIETFNAAHVEHKNRIKACKVGHGVNRHLLGLSLMLEVTEKTPLFFEDSSYQIFITDYFSTSSLGNRYVVGDFAFKPPVSNGLGISYFITDDNQGFLFCVSSHQRQLAEVDRFMQSLVEGTDALMNVFDC